MSTLKVASCTISAESPPFIIAEMSGNHGHDLDKALHLVDAAADAGAHALKLQTYTADTMTLDVRDGDFFIDDPSSLWCGHSLYELYQKAYTPWEWHAPLFERARDRGMVAFSTPFDGSSVDFLETLDVPCYKIASFENGDLPLIRRVSQTGKPVIMSTGTATLEELDEAVACARDSGCRDLILLKCTSCYPADPADANLCTLPLLAQRYGCMVGLSDHTSGTAVAVAAVALGACVIEKHLTLDRGEGDVDAAFSLEPAELAVLVRESRMAWSALGKVCFALADGELKSRRHRRSLYVVKDVKRGEPFTPCNIRAIRPGAGLAPKFLEQALGSVAVQDIAKGTALSLDLLETAGNEKRNG